MKVSKKQQEIFNMWENTNLNILINAVAGSGKTTTLLKLLELCKHKTLFLAFNKSIQEEIQHQIDKNNLNQGKALTIHSLGFSAIKNNYQKISINNSKNFNLIKILQDNNKSIFRKLSWENKLRLSYSIMDMNDVSRMFLTNDIKEIDNYFSTMDKIMYIIPELPKLWKEFINLRDESYNNNSVEIDFNDMIYLPVIKNFTIPIDPYYLMIDEAQDLNLCQHLLIDKLLSQNTIKKWIAVGDRNQAIYGFSGAYSSSFDLFLNKDNVIELPLDICYRCSTGIIKKANEIYNVMYPFKNEFGIVANINNIKYIKENSMIICRNTGPLIDLYFQLLSLDKSCYIKGEDILNSIIRFLKPYNNLTINVAQNEMLYKLEDLSIDHSDSGKYQLYVFKENFNNFKKISEHMCNQYESIDSLINKLKSLFIDKENAIMLCTIHKSKGLESEIVYILNENLIPSKFARSKEQLKQEKNLKYVARTRAKKELYFLNI